MRKHGSYEAMPIALEIGSQSVRLMQLARSEDRLSVEAAARRFFPSDVAKSPQSLAHILRQAIESAPFSTREIVAALPADFVEIRTLRIDPSAAGEIERTVRSTCGQTFSFPLSDARLQCMNAGLIRQGEQERLEIIAVAARNRDVESLLETLEAARLRPISLGLACFAGLHCAQQLESKSSNLARALVELHDESTSVMIRQGQDVKFLRTLPLGTRQLNQAVAQKLGLSLVEAVHLRRRLSQTNEKTASHEGVGPAVHGAIRGLVDQLGRGVAACLRYYTVAFRQPRPESIALLSNDAHDPRINESLGDALGVAIEPIDPLAGIDTTSMRPADRCTPPGEWTTCVGLALGEMREATHV